MLSSPPPSRPAPATPGDDGIDALVGAVLRLRDRAGAARDAVPPGGQRRARWEAAVARLEEAAARLAELRPAAAPAGTARLGARVGSAEWNLLTDEVTWSEETYAIFGRETADGPLTLDQLPACVQPADRPALTAAVTACLVDGRPVDCEVRVDRPDGTARTVQLAGEPVVDDGGGTVAMWAVVRDVSELRRGGAAAAAGAGELQRAREAARGARRLQLALAGAAPVPWLDPLEGADGTAGGLEVAARCLPAAGRSLDGNRGGDLGGDLGGKWFDAMALPGGGRLLSVGDLSGQGAGAAAGAAVAVGALRGVALTGVPPGALLGYLSQLLDRGTHPALASALCCRWLPGDDGGGVLTWAQAGHPAPVVCRAGGGVVLPRPAGTLLGAVAGAAYGERSDRLRPGDVLVLHTDGLFPDISPGAAADLSRDAAAHSPAPGAPGSRPAGRDRGARLVSLAPRIAAATSAAGCLDVVAEACGTAGRAEDACVLVARVAP